MPAAATKRQPEPNPPKQRHAPHIYTLETTGVLVIAALLLVLTLIRYWHFIAWSAR